MSATLIGRHVATAIGVLAVFLASTGLASAQPGYDPYYDPNCQLRIYSPGASDASSRDSDDDPYEDIPGNKSDADADGVAPPDSAPGGIPGVATEVPWQAWQGTPGVAVFIRDESSYYLCNTG